MLEVNLQFEMVSSAALGYGAKGQKQFYQCQLGMFFLLKPALTPQFIHSFIHHTYEKAKSSQKIESVNKAFFVLILTMAKQNFFLGIKLFCFLR